VREGSTGPAPHFGCRQIKDEYQAWARRRLDAVALDYLFLDASFFR
jgi:putative transposase